MPKKVLILRKSGFLYLPYTTIHIQKYPRTQRHTEMGCRHYRDCPEKH